MKFSLDKSYEILERTPSVLRTLLTGLSDDWIMNNEGPETFSPYDVIGHLIHGEKTDWRDRTIMILDMVLQNHLFHLIVLHSLRQAKGNR